MMLLNESHTPIIEDARDVVWRYLAEGVFDPYILKAVFLAGGGGSGKGFISNVMFGTVKDMATTSFGIKSLNSDDLLTALAGELRGQRARPAGPRVGGAATGAQLMGRGLGGRLPLSLKTELGTERGQDIRGRAKQLLGKRKSLFLRGRLGLIIDGTASDPTKLVTRKRELEELGYDTYMVFVNTTLDVALKRNQMRDRVVPEKFVREAHTEVQANIPKFKAAFGKNFVQVDNSKELTQREVTSQLGPRLHRIALKFLAAPLKNPKGWAWLRAETEGMPKSMLKKVTWIGKRSGR